MQPDALVNFAPMQDHTPAIRDLRSYVQWFDDALPREFCTQLIDSFHQMSQFHGAGGIHVRSSLGDSAWTELNVTPLADEAFRGFFYTQIDKYFARYYERLPLSVPVPVRPKLEDLRIKRYLAGKQEKFQPHYDAADEKSSRYMVFLWYLNDVNEGGETLFCDLDVKVQARAGRLLMFPPYWMFQHAGLAPVSNDKYIISTYLLFDRDASK